MCNAGLDESQAGIKNSGRNINNFRYADDSTLMAESEEELKSFLMRMKEESEKADLKLKIHKTKIMASHPITSSQIEGERMADYKLLSSKVTADDNCSYEIKRQLPPGRKAMPYLESEISQSCLTPWNSMDCSLPGFSIHEIFQARILEWVAIPFSRGPS